MLLILAASLGKPCLASLACMYIYDALAWSICMYSYCLSCRCLQGGAQLAQRKQRRGDLPWASGIAWAKMFFPQQRKLMGSSAQISSGVCRCGSQEQVPEEGSGRFRRVPVCAGVGSGGRFRKVPKSSGVCWSCRFRKVLESSVCWVPEFQKVPESYGVCWCRMV